MSKNTTTPPGHTSALLPPSLSELEAPLSHTAVFDALQKEFSPLLDSTLVAALVADIDFDSQAVSSNLPISEQDISPSTDNGSGDLKKKRKQKQKHRKATSNDTTSSGTSYRSPRRLTIDPQLETSLQALYETLKDIAAAAAAQSEVDAVEATSSADFNNKGELEHTFNEGGGARGARDRSSTLTTTTTTASKSAKSNPKSPSSKKRKLNSTFTGSTGITSIDTASACSESSSSTPSSASPETASLGDNDAEALMFLQAALPRISARTLLRALGKSKAGSTPQSTRKDETPGVPGGEDGESDVDMWTLISKLLTSEDAREMDERGLTTLSSDTSSSFSGEDGLDVMSEGDYAYGDDAGDYAHARALNLQEEEEGRRYMEQLDEDERLARELALEMEIEGSGAGRVYNKKDGEEEEWVTAKKTKSKFGKVGGTNGKGKGGVKIKLNDIRQWQYVPPRSRGMGQTGLGSGIQSQDPASSSLASLDGIALLLPSLATYLSALLPRDRSPSALLSPSTMKNGKVTTAMYIQNVFLNERALKSKYAGRVYLAVRACLERVVGEIVLAEKKGYKADFGEEGEEGGGDDTPRKERRKSARSLPPVDTPRLPPGKAKSRVRTAKDRLKDQEREPGEGGVEDGGSTGGSDAEGEAGEENENQQLLFTLLDILLPEYALVDGAQVYVEVHQLLSDIELCIGVTSVGEDALDMAKLLCELYVNDADPTREVWRVMEMFGGDGAGGVGPRKRVTYAEAIGARGVRTTSGVISSSDKRRDGARAVHVKTTVIHAPDKKKHKPSPYQWQAVPTKEPPPKPENTLLPHLPTYTRDVNGIRRKDEGTVRLNGMEVPGWEPQAGGRRKGKASAYEDAERDYRHKIRENMRRRDELLHEAARMYNRGTGGGKIIGRGRGAGKVRGGDVAWYFAERAREFQEAARRESLNAARAMVLRKQVLSGEQETVDLHGTTVNEAVDIVLEMLEGRERGRPLKIVTGRGSHSASGVSVLKPALKKRLVEEGWSVGAWEAGLVVR